MSGSLRPINLGVPDITVVVRENSDANKVLVDVPNISVNIEKSPDYKVSVQPSSVVVQRTGSLPSLAVSALNAHTASYALAVSGSIDTAVSSSYALTASYAQNAGAGSGFPFSGSAVITGSLLLVNDANVGGITGSLLGTASVADAIDIIFAGEFQTGSDAPIVLQVGGTGNVVSASYALTASYAANMSTSVSTSYASTASYVSALSGGARGYIPLWSSNTTISSSGLLYQTASNLILGDGTTFFDETNPDKLGIYAGRTNSFNLVSAHANNDNYLQINIRNFSTGSNSSADIVATYDTGTEDTGYIDMGINGTSYVGTAIHDLPGDGYLFTTGSNLVVGTATPNSTLTLFAGGDTYAAGKLRLFGNNQHQLTGSLNISGSQTILGNQTITGSLTISGSSTFTNIGPSVFSGSINTINGITGSLLGTASVAQTSLTASYALNSIAINTGSFATTGSNTFNNNQTITGSLYISQNLYVQGSSSISYVSQSTLNIGTNVITVNVQPPGTRFGGLSVIDSGSSPQRSGSLFFDSINDQWIFIHQNQTSPTSSVLIMGPQTYNNIGNETNLTTNYIPKSVNAEHIGDSQISDNGTTVSITNGLSVGTSITATSITASVSGTLTGTFPYTSLTGRPSGLVSSSLQINTGSFSGSITTASFATTASTATSITFVPSTASFALTASYVAGATSDWVSLTNKPADLVSSSVQVKAFLPGGTVSASAQYPGWVTASSQIDYNNIQNKLSGVVSSSTQVKPLLPDGSVSSSVQYPGWVTSSTQIINALPLGTVSSSVQVSNYNIFATTGSNIFNGNQIVTGSSTISGSLTVTAATIFSSSLSANSSSLVLNSGSNLYIQNNGIAEITGSLLVTGSMTITGGSLTMPNRPAFRVTGTGGATFAATVLSGSKLNTPDFNQGSHFNTTTGLFTAPVAGLYQVNLIMRTNSNTNSTINQAIVYKSSSAGDVSQIMVEFGVNTTMNHAGGSTITNMAVGDTLRAVIAVGTCSFDSNDNFSVAYIG